MANTSSWSFPNILNPVRNRVNIAEDSTSIVNRARLLLLTDPTELYDNPTFGVGLKKYLWNYNTENTKAMIKDNIKEQLRVYEPSVDADKTTFSDGLLFTESDSTNSATSMQEDKNTLKMTVWMESIYGDKISIDLNDVQKSIDSVNSMYTEITTRTV